MGRPACTWASDSKPQGKWVELLQKAITRKNLTANQCSTVREKEGERSNLSKCRAVKLRARELAKSINLIQNASHKAI